MKLFLIRLLLIVLFFLVFTYVIHWESALLAAFVATYILETLIAEKLH